MKKRTGLLALAVSIIMISTACSPETSSIPNQGAVAEFKTKEFKTLEDLLSDSQVVAEVSVLDDIQNIKYGGSDFITSRVSVKDVIVGDQSLKGKEIKILEMNPETVSKNEKYLVFMEKYVGPVVDNTDSYVIKGVYQGKFHINGNNQVVYEGKKYNPKKTTFQEQYNNQPLQDVKEIIKNNQANK